MASNYAQSSWRNVVIASWDPGPALESRDARRLAALIRQVASAQPNKKCALCCVLREGISLLGAEGKLEVIRFYRQNHPYFSRVVHVVEGHDLLASFARSISEALRLVSRRDYPFVVMSSVNEAAAWLAPHVIGDDGQRSSAAALVRVINAVRSDSGSTDAVQPPR